MSKTFFEWPWTPDSLGNDDEEAWHSWYYERIGYRYIPPPKVTAAVDAVPDLATPRIISCFAAGTPVRTLDGTRPIESIRTGDQVLSRDVMTGSLEFRPGSDSPSQPARQDPAGRAR